MIETSLASIAESLKIIAAALQKSAGLPSPPVCLPQFSVVDPGYETVTARPLTEVLQDRLQKGEIVDTPAVQEAIKPIDPIPEPVPAEVSFDELKTRLFKLRDTGKVWPAGSAGNEKIKEWLKGGWGVKSLQEATPEQRVLIWTAVAGLETA